VLPQLFLPNPHFGSQESKCAPSSLFSQLSSPLDSTLPDPAKNFLPSVLVPGKWPSLSDTMLALMHSSCADQPQLGEPPDLHSC